MSAPVRAALAMLAASALIAVTTLLAKALGQDGAGAALHPLQVSAGRFAFGFAALALIAAIRRPALAGTPLGLHAARTLAGWAGVTCMFAASARMPLADANAISFLSPVAAMVLAVVFLAERVGPWRWAAAGICLAGALVLIRPGSAAFQPAALLALAAALLMGVETILIKQLAGREPVLRLLLVNNAIGTVIAVAAVLAVWQPPTAPQWAMLVAIGLVTVSAQAFFIAAMRLAEASYAMPFFYATLVFAAACDAAVFGVLPDAAGLAGAGIIIAGALLLVWRESRTRRQPPA